MKLIIFLALGLLSSLCFSQNEEQKEQTRRCRVIYLQRTNEAPSEAYLFDGTSSRKVGLSGITLSQVLRFPANKLSISITAESVKDPLAIPEKSPSVEVPDEIGDFLIVVSQDLKNETFPVKMTVIDFGDDRVDLGETLWINMTNHIIDCELGEKHITIEANSQTVSETPRKDAGYYKAFFEYKPNGEGKLMPLMRKSWWFDPKSKNIGFVVDTGRLLPRIYSLRDRQEGETEKK